MASDSIKSLDTLGEKHKTLNMLVRTARQDPLSKEELQQLSNKNQTELIYIARLANHNKDGLAVCELLKSQNTIVVSNTLRSKWFFTGKTHPIIVNIEYFKKELFPYVSYHTICRIASNLSAHLVDETLAEDFYKYFYESYGYINMTIKLLPKCSKHFICEEMKKSYVKLPPSVLNYIYDKDRTIISEYLEEKLKMDQWEESLNRYLIRLASDDFKYFCEFIDKIHENINCPKIGQKLTKKFMKVYTKEVLSDPSKYPYLDKKTLLKCLNLEQLSEYLYFNEPIGHYKREKRGFNYLKREFRSKMYKQLYWLGYLVPMPEIDNINTAMDMETFDSIPLETRVKWVNEKIENLQPHDRRREDYYLKYSSVDIAIPRYQALCKATDDWQQRSSYLDNMVECCSINKDTKALLELCKYVANRHRNDVPSIRHNFLYRVHCSFTLEELSSEHWEVLNEMIEFILVKKELEVRHSTIMNYYNGYLSFSVKHNLDFEVCLNKIMKNTEYISNDLRTSDAKVWNAVFDKYKQVIIQKVNTEDPSETEEGFKKVIDLIYLVNCSHTNISEANNLWLTEFIKQNQDKMSNDLKSNLFGCLQLTKRNREIFLNEFFQYALNKRLLYQYVKHSPNVILNHTDHMIEMTTSLKNANCGYNRIFEKINVYVFSALNEKITSILTKSISDYNIENVQQRAMHMIFLCYMLPSADVKNLLEKESPSDLKIKDITTESEMYNKAEILAKYMGTINPPIEYSTLLMFLGGDYLKYSLRSMFSLIRKKPFEETKQFIYGLIAKPISVKKHFVHLSYSLYPRNELLPLYKLLWSNEKNPSMRNTLFTFTYNLMRTEDDMQKYNEIWSIVKFFMNGFIETDVSLLSHLNGSSDVKTEVRAEYCELCWSVLQRLLYEKVDVSHNISSLFYQFNYWMKFLRTEFSESIMLEYLNSLGKKNMKYNTGNLLNFVVEFVLTTQLHEDQSKLMSKICRYYTEHIRSTWNSKTEGAYKQRNDVKNFIHTLCKKCIELKPDLNPSYVFESITEMLLSCLQIDCVFQYIIIMNLTRLYWELLVDPKYVHLTQYQRRSEMMMAFGRRVVIYINELSQKYGEDIYIVFINIFKESINILFPYMHNVWFNLEIANGLLEEDVVSRQNIFMAIHFLPSVLNENEYEDSKKNILSYLQTLIDKIMSKNDASINITLRNKIPWYNDTIKD